MAEGRKFSPLIWIRRGKFLVDGQEYRTIYRYSGPLFLFGWFRRLKEWKRRYWLGM